MPPILVVALAIAAPLIAAIAMLSATEGAGPMHAERHDRRREHRQGVVFTERSVACLFGLLAAAILVGSLIYLWESKPF